VSDYGRPLFSFPDPRAPQWALFFLGLALLLASGLIVLLVVVEGAPKDDRVAGAIMLGAMTLAGLFCFVAGLRDLIASPEWHVSATHAFRTRGARVLRALALRDQPAPAIVSVERYGQRIGVRVDLGRWHILTPSMDVARAVVEAWRSAQGAR
jgi:hypothetical protein